MSSTITVVNVRNSSYDVYCGRTSHGRQSEGFGNPFPLYGSTRGIAIDKFLVWLYSPDGEQMRERIEQVIVPLARSRPIKLGCWCAPEPCHADIIAHYALSKL